MARFGRRLVWVAAMVFCCTLVASSADCFYLGSGVCNLNYMASRSVDSTLLLISLAMAIFLPAIGHTSIETMSAFGSILWAVLSTLVVYWLQFSVGMTGFRDSQLELSQVLSVALAIVIPWGLGKTFSSLKFFHK
jgi:hypothetical protein